MGIWTSVAYPRAIPGYRHANGKTGILSGLEFRDSSGTVDSYLIMSGNIACRMDRGASGKTCHAYKQQIGLSRDFMGKLLPAGVSFAMLWNRSIDSE